MVPVGMKKKNSLWLLQEFKISIQFLNQLDKNPLNVLQIVGLDFVELVLEDESLCYHILQLLRILCTTCYKSCASLQSSRCSTGPFAPSEFSTNELPRVFVSASFPSCRNVRVVLYKYVHPTLYWFVTLDTADIS